MDSDNEKQKLKKFLGKPGKSKRNRDDNSKIGSPLTKKKKKQFLSHGYVNLNKSIQEIYRLKLELICTRIKVFNCN